MSEWRTIDSAPKDGTRILVFSNEFFHKQEFAVAYWHVAFTGDEGGWNVTCYGGHESEPEVEPTHWMPLPDPPKT